MMFKRVTIFLILAGLVFCLGCTGNDKPFHPGYLREGRVSIYNQSGVRIRLLDYTQARGDEEINVVLNRSLNSGFRYYLLNLLDGGDSDIFPGGDYITVRYRSEVANPDDPMTPLFDKTIDHTVNGITVYYVKTGGRYTVSP
jgi:hypothetical protein